MQNKYVVRAWNLLYYAYGLVPIVAGADKFFHYIVNWDIYLNPRLPALINMSVPTFMHGVGVIEILAGLLVFYRPVYGGYVVALWLLAIVGNLLSMGMYYDIALRDTVLALGAYVLVLLTYAMQESREKR